MLLGLLLDWAASPVLSVFWPFSYFLSFSFLDWFQLGLFAEGFFDRAHFRIAITI